MPGGLNALHTALAAATQPVVLFLRDDDAGWDDRRLHALLDCTQRAGVPIDLAAIPLAVTSGLAHSLAQTEPRLVGIHQHGYAHLNHQGEGRKAEFGDGRSLADQAADLQAGQDRLRELLGDRLDAIFTPPWNRCAATTPALLRDRGYAALSRDRSAPVQQALPEIAVAVDWCKQRRLAAASGDDALDKVARALAESIAGSEPLGLMLHHAEMDEGELRQLDALLAALNEHPRVAWRPMRELIAVPA